MDQSQRIKLALARLRDELIVRNHLAGMDIKEAVDSVALELDRWVARLDHSFSDATAAVVDEAQLQGHLALLEIRERLTAVEDVLRQGLHGAAKSQTFMQETARLHLTLARMEAEQDLSEQVKRLRLRRHQLAEESVSLLHDLEHRLEVIARETNKYI